MSRPTRRRRPAKARAALRKDPVEQRTERAVVAPFSIEQPLPVGERWLNGLIFAEYGFGKTTLAATADDEPTMQDVLFLSAEAGEMSLTNRPWMDMVRVRSYKQVARIFEYLVIHCKYRDEGNLDKLWKYEFALKGQEIIDKQNAARAKIELPALGPDNPSMYRTVIIDTLTEIQRYLVYQFLGIDILKTKIDEEIEKMEEWQTAQEMMRFLVRSFRDLDMHVIMVAAQEIEKERSKAFFQPKLPGQLSGDVVGFMDLVGYLHLIRKEGLADVRRLYLGAGHEGFISKHRFTNLPDLDYVEDPTMSALIELGRKDTESGQGKDSDSSYGRRSARAATRHEEPTPSRGGRGRGRPGRSAGARRRRG